MPPDQSNLPEGVEVWTIYSPTGDGSTGYVALHGDYVAEHPGAILVYYDLPKIIAQARQEEREKLRLALARAAVRWSVHMRDVGLALSVTAIQNALDSLDLDIPEGGSNG